MGKITYYISIIMVLLLVLSGCSYRSTNSNNSSEPEGMDVLKNLTVIYTEQENFVVPEDYYNIDSVVNKFFSDKSNNGFIAEIVPIEYVFYYTIDKDEDTGELYIDGYAECKCSVEKISQKFNLSNYSAEEIYIRRNIFLVPVNEEAVKEMLESIGAYKNDTCIEGTYKIPSKFINATDYKLLVRHSSWMLLEDKTYYSLITFEDDIAYLYKICDGLNESGKDISIGNDFQKFLVANDPDLLAQDD